MEKDFSNKLTWRYVLLRIAWICLFVLVFIIFRLIQVKVEPQAPAIDWLKECAIMFLVPFCFVAFTFVNEMRNSYILTDKYLYIKEYYLFRKKIDLKIPLDIIQNVKLGYSHRWLNRHIMIETNNLTYDLWAVTYKNELFNELNTIITKRNTTL